MSNEEQDKKKTQPPRMYYGVNAAAYLTAIELDARLRLQEFRASKGYANEGEFSRLISRGSIQQVFIHYLRFIRSLSLADLGA